MILNDLLHHMILKIIGVERSCLLKSSSFSGPRLTTAMSAVGCTFIFFSCSCSDDSSKDRKVCALFCWFIGQLFDIGNRLTDILTGCRSLALLLCCLNEEFRNWLRIQVIDLVLDVVVLISKVSKGLLAAT